MKFLATAILASLIMSIPLSASICPATGNTNTDCGYLLTIGVGDVITGAPVLGASPYDGNDDALVGVINKSGAVYNGSITLSGTGNGGGIFGFDGDGICAFTGAAYCAKAATGYEGPNNTFTNISADATTGTIVFSGVGSGKTTFFSLEGSPSSIKGIVVSPEPATIAMLGAGLASLAILRRKRKRAA